MKRLLTIFLFCCLIGPAAADAATKRLQAYTTLAAPATGDWLFISDVSDSGREYKIPVSALFGSGITSGISPLWANQTITDYTYYISDDTTHYVAVAAGNNLANYVLRWPESLGTGGLLTASALGQLSFTDPASFLTPSGVGGALTVTATGFDGNLATTDNTVQEIAQKFDDFVGGGGYTNLTSFVAQTPWRLFYSNASGDVVELGFGADGEYLKSNGASLAPTWATPSGAAHDAVTLGTDADILLGLSTQQLTLDSQTANYIFAAPNGSAGDPTFRALADADIPSAIARDSEIPAAVTDATISTSAVATNDASTTKHGWLMMATAPAAGLRNVLAIDNAETGYKNAALFDATTPAAETSGASGATGSAMTAARRDHVHALPTIPTVSDTAYSASTWDANTDAASKNAIRDKFEALAPSGTDGEYGIWWSAGNTVNPTTYSTSKIGYSTYNNLPVFCYNGTCTGFMTNPMTTAGDMIKGGTSGAATRMIPGTGVLAALEATPNATGGVLLYGNAAVAASVLTGYTSGAGTVAATDTILQAIQKLNGNDGLKANAADAVLTSSTQIPNGANPTTDAAGEVAVDTSTGAGQGVRAYGAVGFTLPAYQTKCTTINAATASSDFMVETLPYAITIRAAHVNQIGATNVIGHFDECDSAGATCATIDSTADITATTTKTNDDGTLSNPSIDSGDVISWHTTSVSGTNTQLMVCFDYTVDQVN